MTEWWTCQTLPLPYTVCMSPLSAPHAAIWDILAYPRQFTAHFNIIHICWVKSNSQLPMQWSYDAMTHFKRLAHIKHAWAAKQFRNAKQQGMPFPTLYREGQIPFGQTSPDCYLGIPPQQYCDFYSKCSGKRNKKETAATAVSECVECIELVRHGNECVISGNNAMFWSM